MERPDRLYGAPGDEILWLTPEEVLEAHDPIDSTFIVEEWTVASNRRHLPDARWVLEYALEMGGIDSTTEGWWDAAEDAAHKPEVLGAFETALDILAHNIRYWMADEKVETHVYVHGSQGEWVRWGSA